MRLLSYTTALILVCASLTAQQWTTMGPVIPPNGMSTIGQINCIAFNPFNPNRMYAGGPAGGLWYTSDAGSNWLNAATDTLSVIGISDIVISPTDSNNIFIALGDRDENAAYVPQGGALYQTTDGGVSWFRSGELDTNGSIVPLTNFTASRIIRNSNSGLLTLGSSVGLFTSSNFGTNWNNRLYKEKVWDIKYRPNDVNYIYAVISGKIYRSVNGGTTYTQVSAGLPTTVGSRIQLAVTPANGAVVYAMYVNVDGTFGGLFKSSDYGTSWTQKSSSPNILAANPDGSGSKGINNLALAVSSTNENIIFAGGVNVWKSLDGGVNWSLSSHYQGVGAPFVSADIHELKFAPSPRAQFLYACTGSGVFVTSDTGRSWQNISNGLQVAQIIRSAHHFVRDSLYLAATPTGVLRLANNIWTKVSDSSAIDVIFNPTQENVAYMVTANGKLYRSRDTGQTFTDDLSPSTAPNGVAYTPYVFNPKNYNTIYALLRDIWKTTNGGQTWTRTLNTFNANLTSLVVSPKDTSMLYMAVSDTSLYQSINGGQEWKRASRIALQIPGLVRALCIHPTDASRVCAFGGRSVSMSTDGGQSWNKYVLTNNTYISSMFWKADNCGEELIFGTSNGVFKLSAQFQFGLQEAFGSQIPNSPITDLKLSGRYLRASTAGRGMYQAFVDDVGVVPDFSQDKAQVCPGEFVQFYDQSKFGGLSTKWVFQGGIPNTSTESSPLVRFDSPGDHSVMLVASNGCGKDSITRVCVNVIPKLKANIGLPKPAACVGDTLQISDISVGAGGTRDWTVTGANIVKKTASAVFVECIQTGTVDIMLSLSNSCGTNAASKKFDVYTVPNKPSITTVKDTMSTKDSTGLSYQWYVNGNPLTGGTTSVWVGRFSGDYLVRVSNAGGCKVYSDTVHFEKTKDTTGGGSWVMERHLRFSIVPNPASDEFRLQPEEAWSGTVSIIIRDMLGRIVLSHSRDCDGSDSELHIGVEALADGLYTIEVHDAVGAYSRTLVKQR